MRLEKGALIFHYKILSKTGRGRIGEVSPASFVMSFARPV